MTATAAPSSNPSIVQRLVAHFTTTALVLIPIAAGINLVGGWIASTLKLPVFLDTIGTVIAAVLAGPWVAAVVGLVTNIFEAIVVNPVYLPYATVNIALGIVVGLMAMYGHFKPWPGIIVTWLLTALTTTTTSSIISVALFGGITGATGSSLITAYFLATGNKLITSVFASSMIAELADKGIAVAVGYLVIRNIPKRFLGTVTRRSTAS